MTTTPARSQSTREPGPPCGLTDAEWVEWWHNHFRQLGRADRAKGMTHTNRVSTPDTDTVADYQTQREGDWTR